MLHRRKLLKTAVSATAAVASLAVGKAHTAAANCNCCREFKYYCQKVECSPGLHRKRGLPRHLRGSPRLQFLLL